MNIDEKIKSFSDLKAWQKSHELVLIIYKLTKNFPREEQYGLISQMKRASISISSNIAEGFSRHSPKEKLQFYYQALGSLTEIQNQLLVARDIGYISNDLFQEIADLSVEVAKLIRSLMKFLNTKY